MIGETIGNFRVTARLGAGGMGEVYLAEQTSIETKVAIKVLRPEISVDRQHVDRFFNEARAVSKIKHAGTVKIFDVGFHIGHAYLVMEFLEGETLSARIQRIGSLPLAQISDIGKQACGVLEATHTAGITHRDLKPDNIFIVPDSELASGERVKILDFGIAKLTGATIAGKPMTVGTMGTPAYMAPEQWGDAGKVDSRADVYSMGCVLFEMATGQPPFRASNFAEACAAHLSQPPPKLRSITPVFPPQLEALIDSMLAKSPEARPSVRDIGRQLGELATMPNVSGPAHATPAQVAPTVAPNAPTYGVGHQPTPVDQQTPRHAPVGPTTPVAQPIIPTPHYPPNLVPGPDGQPVPHTTISSATGSTTPVVEKSRAGIYFAIGGVVAVILIVIAATRGDGTKATADAGVAKPADAAVASTPDAPAVATPDAPAAPVWQKPQFGELAAGKVMIRQATRADYRGYLGTLAGDARTKAMPLNDWSEDRPNDPVGWVTFEQAQAFCRAIDGGLPTKEQWLALAEGGWRIGSPVPGEVVFRDWTATVTGGLAIVLGGTTTMPNDATRMQAVKNPLSKTTVAAAGPDPLPGSIAAATIGIRCVQGVIKLPKPAGGSTGGASIGGESAGTGGTGLEGLARKPPPDTSSCAGASGLESQGDTARASGDYARALVMYEAALRCKPALAQKAYWMACRSHEFLKAKKFFGMLGGLQETVVQLCLNEGYDPRK